MAGEHSLAASEHVVPVTVLPSGLSVTHNYVVVNVYTPARNPTLNVILQMDSRNTSIFRRGVSEPGLETGVVIPTGPKELSPRYGLDDFI